jgi:GT2 family glycosyltransferase
MVYILIPAHNNKNEVLEVLSCLHKQTYEDIKIVLVDDGSLDSTEAEVRKIYPKVAVLRGNGNLWWTGANVMGLDHILKETKPNDFVLLLNNDLVVDDNYVEILVNASNCHHRAIVGSVLVDYDNHNFMESGLRLDNQLNISVNRDNCDIENLEFDTRTDVLPGRGTLVPVEVFAAIGSFNRRMLPHYGADYEFAIRASRAGFRLIVSNKARVFAKLNISGIDIPDKKIISLRECFTLLFSKRSRCNLLHGLNYAWLCSKKGFRFKNTMRTFAYVLRNTLCKTTCLYPAYRLVCAISGFCFRGYPLSTIDIEGYGMEPNELMSSGMIKEHRINGTPFYYVSPELEGRAEMLPAEKKEKIRLLRRLSFNYFHKLKVLHRRMKLLFPVR